MAYHPWQRFTRLCNTKCYFLLNRFSQVQYVHHTQGDAEYDRSTSVHVYEVLVIQESDWRNAHLKETIYEFLIENFLEYRGSFWDASHSVQFLQDLKRPEGCNPRMVVRLFCH